MEMTFGAEDAWNAMIFPPSHPANTSFVQQTIDAARSLFIDPASQFLQRAQAAFDHYNSDAALRFARRVIGNMHTNEVPTIVEYGILSELQNANMVMQRWIMANPNVRKLYAQQRCDGYSDTYIDIDPGCVGDNHYDYRRVMNAMVIEQNDGSWKAANYYDDLRDGDRELVLEEQVAILNTWSAVDALLAIAKGDPTSSSGGNL